MEELVSWSASWSVRILQAVPYLSCSTSRGTLQRMHMPDVSRREQEGEGGGTEGQRGEGERGISHTWA